MIAHEVIVGYDGSNRAAYENTQDTMDAMAYNHAASAYGYQTSYDQTAIYEVQDTDYKEDTSFCGEEGI